MEDKEIKLMHYRLEDKEIKLMYYRLVKMLLRITTDDFTMLKMATIVLYVFFKDFWKNIYNYK